MAFQMLYSDQFKNNVVTPGYPSFQKGDPFWHLVKENVEESFEECAYIAEDNVKFFNLAALAAPEAPGAIVGWEGETILPFGASPSPAIFAQSPIPPSSPIATWISAPCAYFFENQVAITEQKSMSEIGG